MAGIIGPRETLLVGAVCCLGSTLFLPVNFPKSENGSADLRKNGIIKEVAEGVETTAEQPMLSDNRE